MQVKGLKDTEAHDKILEGFIDYSFHLLHLIFLRHCAHNLKLFWRGRFNWIC